MITGMIQSRMIQHILEDIKKRNEKINVILSYNNYAETLILPVVPDQLEIKTGLNNNTLEVISLGEIGVIGNRKLKTITVSSFFPKYYSSYLQCGENEMSRPYAAVEKIERWRDSKRPIRITITGMSVNMPCMIEEFSYREKGGQPGDVYYDLVLKEYRFIQPKIIQPDNNGNRRPVERQNSATYTVKKGDSLYAIAKLKYGDGRKYKELYEKNRNVIGPDPNLIKPGQVLVL
ncbi:MAG: LysM peptidoglycan-binding domain-containing protein [Clostridia bacterium]|nr:LysM peptidoglycan-binding domain-containing protein [Clostridia bacterium]